MITDGCHCAVMIFLCVFFFIATYITAFSAHQSLVICPVNTGT